MHVDWKWIFQRPHVIAKGLEKDYDVTVAYLFNYRQQRKMQKNNLLPQKTVKIYNIPYEGKNIFIYYLNKVWLRWYRQISTFPPFIPCKNKHHILMILFTCMDNLLKWLEKKTHRLLRRLKQNGCLMLDKIFKTSRFSTIRFESQLEKRDYMKYLKYPFPIHMH